MSAREPEPLGEGTQTLYYSNGWVMIRSATDDDVWVASDTTTEVTQ